MKKRILALLLATTMICGLFTACGRENNSTGNNENAESNKTESSNTEANPFAGYSEKERSYLEMIQEGYDWCKENGTEGEFVMVEIEGFDNPFFFMKSKTGGEYNVVYDHFGNWVYGRYFSKEGYIWSQIEPTTGVLTETFFVLVKDEERIQLTRVSIDEESSLAQLHKPQFWKGDVEITEEEFNKEMELLKDCTWIELSSIDTWYTDICKAYDNRLSY